MILLFFSREIKPWLTWDVLVEEQKIPSSDWTGKVVGLLEVHTRILVGECAQAWTKDDPLAAP